MKVRCQKAEVRSFYKSEVKQLQNAMNRRYRLIWSTGNKEPLIEMEGKHVNMWDVRRQLGVERIRKKIEIAHFRRIVYVLRLLDDRLVKGMVLGRNAKLEDRTKAKRRQQTTLSYWRKLLTGVAISHKNLQAVIDLKRLNSKVKSRK